MSKNITIAEGTQAKNFNNVSKIRTNVIGGGTQLWVPEDEAKNYVDFGTLSTTENGTFYADDEGVDGFSEVIVNVPTVEPTLTTKTITQNGTYNASDDNADGYSSVVVNVKVPHGITIGGGINNAPVNSRMSTKDFLDSFNEALYGIALNIYSRASDIAWAEQWFRKGAWLLNYIPEIYNYNNLIFVGGGGLKPNSGWSMQVWLWILGVMDNTADITLADIDDTAGNFTAILSSANKFTTKQVTGSGAISCEYAPNVNIWYFTPWNGEQGVRNAIDNNITGETQAIETRNIDSSSVRSDRPYLQLMTNLTGGTRP